MPRKQAFTLLEIIVALTIVGALAAISAFSYTNLIQQGASQAAQTNLLTIVEAEHNYYFNKGAYCLNSGALSTCADNLSHINSNLTLNINDPYFTYSCGTIIGPYAFCCTATNILSGAALPTRCSGTCVSTGCAAASTIACGTAYTDNCGAPCGNGTSCSSPDFCLSGVCDFCTPNSSTACGGGACAGTKTCNSAGSAYGNCSSSGNGCVAATTCTNASFCNTSGICPAATNVPNGTICNDGNACTINDNCTNGTCAGTNNPVNATLSGWSACSVSCGPGTETRTCTGASCGGDPTCGGAPLSQGCNPGSCCSPDCSCASSTCSGNSCDDGCGGTCTGTYVPSCGDGSVACVGQTYSVGCGVTCTGTNTTGTCGSGSGAGAGSAGAAGAAAASASAGSASGSMGAAAASASAGSSSGSMGASASGSMGAAAASASSGSGSSSGIP